MQSIHRLVSNNVLPDATHPLQVASLHYDVTVIIFSIVVTDLSR